MKTKYPVAADGEWLQPIRRGYRLKCCDCGLIHTINFRIRSGHIQFQAFRDNRATAQTKERKGRGRHAKP